MIYAITGRPGGGKTLHAVRILCERLRSSPSLRVVTNLPLRLPELNEYLQGCNVVSRVRILSEDEVRHFWRYRGQRLGAAGEPLGEVVGEPAGDTVRYPPDGLWPVLYILDEFHLYFNAREWAKVGKEALWYASQHRHFGDDVYWISQYYGNVDKQFRVLVQDWTTCRNWCKESFRGFSLPSRYKVEISLEPPDKLGRTVVETRLYRPDPGLWQLYDTSAGAGLPGGLPPEQPSRRRKPPWWLGVLGVLLLAAVVALSLPRVSRWVLSRGLGALTSGVSPASQSGQAQSPLLSSAPSTHIAPLLPEAPQPRTDAVCTARWVLPDGRQFLAWRLPDGTSYVWDGQRLRLLP